MTTRMILACTTLVVPLSGLAWATEYGTLTPVWKKELVQEGTGDWDWKVKRDLATGENCGEGPRGLAVDNQGCIYVCDSYSDRLLVFSPNGERQEIIQLKKWIRFPSEINVDKDNNLFVVGVDSSLEQQIQVIMSPSGSGWNTTTLDRTACELAPEAGGLKRSDMRIIPLGCAGLRVMSMPLIKVEGKWKYQILNEHGKSAGFAPSVYRDQKGRYYDLFQKRYLRVFSEAGDLKAEVDVPGSPAQLVPFRGYIYVYAWNKLQRYDENGTIEEDVTTSSKKNFWSPCLASPLADHFYSYKSRNEGGVYSLTVTKWKYEQTPPTSEKDAKKE